MHTLYTHYLEQNIHIYMCMGKPWEEMFLKRDFQANGVRLELRAQAAVWSEFHHHQLFIPLYLNFNSKVAKTKNIILAKGGKNSK